MVRIFPCPLSQSSYPVFLLSRQSSFWASGRGPLGKALKICLLCARLYPGVRGYPLTLSFKIISVLVFIFRDPCGQSLFGNAPVPHFSSYQLSEMRLDASLLPDMLFYHRNHSSHFWLGSILFFPVFLSLYLYVYVWQRVACQRIKEGRGTK